MNWLGSMVLPQLRAGGNVGFAKRWIGDCGGQYLDIKDKTALGICKNRYAGVV